MSLIVDVGHSLTTVTVACWVTVTVVGAQVPSVAALDWYPDSAAGVATDAGADADPEAAAAPPTG